MSLGKAGASRSSCVDVRKQLTSTGVKGQPSLGMMPAVVRETPAIDASRIRPVRGPDAAASPNDGTGLKEIG